jgi:hypothetical protein
MTVLVADGQGGGSGRSVASERRAADGESLEILAAGANSLAAAVMLKAGGGIGLIPFSRSAVVAAGLADFPLDLCFRQTVGLVLCPQEENE